MAATKAIKCLASSTGTTNEANTAIWAGVEMPGSKSAMARDTHPRATGSEIAPREDVSRLRPKMCRRRGTGEKLIAVCGYQQRITRMRLPGKQDQAHGRLK